MSDEVKDVPAKEKAIDEVEFHFEVDSSYRIHAANGAMVGPTPRGEIKIDFFVESNRLPAIMIHSVIEGSGLGPVIRQKPDEKNVAVRRMQTGVLLTLNQARELAKAILQKADQLETLLKLSEGKKDASVS